MHLPNFRYLAPRNTGELAAMLTDQGDGARILSGGTDLLVQMKSPGANPECLIDINGLDELAEIDFDKKSGLVIGSAAKLEAVLEAPAVKEHYFALWQAIGAIGARQIRTMGSLGGNICNASPAADTPPPLVALGATVMIAGAKDERALPLEEFILGNRETALKRGEYLKSITVPTPAPNSGGVYHHFRVRGGMDIAMVSAAAHVELDEDTETIKEAKIVLGVVGPTPIRAIDGEQLLAGQKPSEELLEKVSLACADASKPIDDFRASAEYRKEVLRVLVEESIEEAYSRAAC